MAGRIGQQAALDCFEAVWRTGVDEMFHDVWDVMTVFRTGR